MTNISHYLSDKVLGYTLLGSGFTQVVTAWLALVTAVTSTDAGSVTEVVATIGTSPTSYARIRGVFNAPATSGDGRRCTNNGALSFTQAALDWGTITHVCIYDALTGGNLLYWGALSSSKTINQGETAQFPDTQLTVTIS